MSAPGDSGPTQGYYPDPSIPGYIRYWNGSAWVPGTSRPAPSEGEAVPAPPADADAGGQGPGPAAAEQPPIDTTQQAGPLPDQTGPVFFDEQPGAGALRGALPELRPRGEVGVRPPGDTAPSAVPADQDDAEPWHEPHPPSGASPAAGASWHADAGRQAGYGSEPDQRVSWGAEDSAPARPAAAPAWGAAPADPRLVPPTGMGPVPSATHGGPATAAGPAAAGAPTTPPAAGDPAEAAAPAGATERPAQTPGRELDPGAAPRAALPAGQTPAVPRQGGAPGEPAPTTAPAPAAASGRAAEPAVPAQATAQAQGSPGTGAVGGSAAPGAGTAGREGTLTLRAPGGEGQEPAAGTAQRGPGDGTAGQPGGRDGTLTIRALGRTTPTAAAQAPAGPAAQAPAAAGAQAAAGPAAPPTAPQPAPATSPAQATPPAQPAAPQAAPPQAAPSDGAHPQPVPGTQLPGQGGPPGGAGPGAVRPAVPHGAGGGQADWAQRVHDLAQPPGPGASGSAVDDLVPWKPPVNNPFLSSAQAEGRPAGLGRRLAARLIDTVLLGGVVGAVALPLWTKAKDHIDEKVDAAKQTGETVTVYLLDGTTGGYLAIVLAALLLLGVVYEVLPTARWGRTLGKQVCGVRVLDIEGHDTPSFSAALRRWLVYGVLGLLVVGVANVVWCLVDRPWRQCWHDKAARTFVASRPR